MKSKLICFVVLASLACQAAEAVDVDIDDSQARDIRDYLLDCKQQIQRYWDDIADFLKSPGFTPPNQIALIADARGGTRAHKDRIWFNARDARNNADDMGIAIQLTSYLIQAIYKDGCPMWLIHGTARYIRYFRLSIYPDERPGKPPNRGQRGYERYGETEYFLNWIQRKKNDQAVQTLNRACREGRYSDNLWNQLTGQSAQENYDQMQRERSFE